MKLTKLSLAAIVIAGFATSSFAGNSLANAFKKGTVSGSVNVYAEKYNISNNANHGFSMDSVDLNYETGTFNGFKVSLGARGNHDFNEVNNGDYGDGSEPGAVLHTANVSYSNDYFTMILGRQELDLEWMGDYHEAYTAILTAIPNTTITYVHSVRYADHASEDDDALQNFSKNDEGTDGTDVIDMAYNGPIKGMQLDGYYYHQKDQQDWYGAKVNFDNDIYGFTAQYAKTDSDVQANPNGSILALEARGNIKGVSLAAGYITTDKDGGIDHMDNVGDNINPLEDGNHVYDPDADTTYGSVSYEISDVGFSAMYGSTNYGNNTEKELDLDVEYDGIKNLEIEAVYVNINSDDTTTNGNGVKAEVTYSF
jgi:hypothetical protein